MDKLEYDYMPTDAEMQQEFAEEQREERTNEWRAKVRAGQEQSIALLTRIAATADMVRYIIWIFVCVGILSLLQRLVR